MSDLDIKAMVDRFLSWRLPEDFNPDGGVTFDPFRIPTGTNLFTAVQAEAMIRHMLGGEEPADECPTCHLTPADAEKVDVYCGDPWHKAHPTAGKEGTEPVKMVPIRGKHLELS